MNARKQKNMMAAYNGFTGNQTVRAITAQIPQELGDRLTGYELGLVMGAINDAYHRGRASMGGIDVQDNCLWLPDGDPKGPGKLIPLAVLRQIGVAKTTTETIVPCYGTCRPHDCDADGNPLTESAKYIARISNGKGAYHKQRDYQTTYTLNATERS